MKKKLNGLWKFINSKIFGYLILFIVAFFLINMFNNNKDLKDEIRRQKHNYEVSQDSIETILTKNGQLESSILAYEGYTKELENYNKKLYDEIQKEKGKVVTYSNLIFRLKQDSTNLAKEIDRLNKILESKQVNDSTWRMHWTLPYVYDSLNYDIYSGITEIGITGNLPKICIENLRLVHNDTWMTDRDSKMSLTWGQKYENGKLKVFARTSHPAYSAQLLEGVYVDINKPDKGWFKGLGMGPYFGMGYDFLNNQPAMSVGVSIHYNLYKW